MGIRTVKGVLTGMQGKISFDESNLKNSSFDVCVGAWSINTENEKRDYHLKNSDFFDVINFPNICFKSTSISKTNNGFKAIGKLSMHGITLETKLPFTYSNGIFKGDFELERLDYKIGENYGGFLIGKTVEIKITCVLITSI